MPTIFSFGPYVLRKKLLGQKLDISDRTTGQCAVVPNVAAKAVRGVFSELERRKLPPSLTENVKSYALHGAADYSFDRGGVFASLLVEKSAKAFVDAALERIPSYRRSPDTPMPEGWKKLYDGPVYRLEGTDGVLRVLVRGMNAYVPVDPEVKWQLIKIERELRALSGLPQDTLTAAVAVSREYCCVATTVSLETKAAFLEMAPTLFALSIVAEAIDRKKFQ